MININPPDWHIVCNVRQFQSVQFTLHPQSNWQWKKSTRARRSSVSLSSSPVSHQLATSWRLVSGEAGAGNPPSVGGDHCPAEADAVQGWPRRQRTVLGETRSGRLAQCGWCSQSLQTFLRPRRAVVAVHGLAQVTRHSLHHHVGHRAAAYQEKCWRSRLLLLPSLRHIRLPRHSGPLQRHPERRGLQQVLQRQGQRLNNWFPSDDVNPKIKVRINKLGVHQNKLDSWTTLKTFPVFSVIWIYLTQTIEL